MALSEFLSVLCPDSVSVCRLRCEKSWRVCLHLFSSAQNVKVKLLSITRQVLGRPVCDRGAIPRTLVQSNVGEKQTNNID